MQMLSFIKYAKKNKNLYILSKFQWFVNVIMYINVLTRIHNSVISSITTVDANFSNLLKCHDITTVRFTLLFFFCIFNFTILLLSFRKKNRIEISSESCSKLGKKYKYFFKVFFFFQFVKLQRHNPQEQMVERGSSGPSGGDPAHRQSRHFRHFRHDYAGRRALWHYFSHRWTQTQWVVIVLRKLSHRKKNWHKISQLKGILKKKKKNHYQSVNTLVLSGLFFTTPHHQWLTDRHWACWDRRTSFQKSAGVYRICWSRRSFGTWINTACRRPRNCLSEWSKTGPKSSSSSPPCSSPSSSMPLSCSKANPVFWRYDFFFWK